MEIKDYKKKLRKYIHAISPDEIERAMYKIKFTIDNNKKIFIIGNGGSMATAMHFAEDLMLNNDFKVRVFHLGCPSAMTAIANDRIFDEVFVNQLKNMMDYGDLVIAISCSGGSPNIVKAVKYANTLGSTISISGFDGGRVEELSTHSVFVKTEIGEYELTEDLHLAICHMIVCRLKKDWVVD